MTSHQWKEKIADMRESGGVDDPIFYELLHDLVDLELRIDSKEIHCAVIDDTDRRGFSQKVEEFLKGKGLVKAQFQRNLCYKTAQLRHEDASEDLQELFTAFILYRGAR
jgi:hypothetical protein